jgi:hypothetical protein
MRASKPDHSDFTRIERFLAWIIRRILPADYDGRHIAGEHYGNSNPTASTESA